MKTKPEFCECIKVGFCVFEKCFYWSKNLDRCIADVADAEKKVERDIFGNSVYNKKASPYNVTGRR